MALKQFWVCVHCDLDLEDMTLAQGHNTPLGHGQQLCEILSRSIKAVRSWGPDTDFPCICIVTLTLESRRYDLDQGHDTPLGHGQQLCEILSRSKWQWGVMARTQIFSMCAQWPWHGRYDLGSRSWHTFESWTIIVWNIIQIPTRQWGVIARTRIFSMCAMWPWPWRHDLGSRTWHTLESWTTIVWNIIQIKHGRKEL